MLKKRIPERNEKCKKECLGETDIWPQPSCYFLGLVFEQQLFCGSVNAALLAHGLHVSTTAEPHRTVMTGVGKRVEEIGIQVKGRKEGEGVGAVHWGSEGGGVSEELQLTVSQQTTAHRGERQRERKKGKGQSGEEEAVRAGKVLFIGRPQILKNTQWQSCSLNEKVQKPNNGKGCNNYMQISSVTLQ